MDAWEKFVYRNANIDALMIIQFMEKQNFYDNELEEKLQEFINKINEYLKNEH